MEKKGIILLLLVMFLAGDAFCDTTRIPVSNDVYISLGTGNEQVYNQTDRLLCAVNVTNLNGTNISNYPGAPIIQFDISNINVTYDDVAILALKAASIEKQTNDSAMVALLSIGSEWDEESDLTTFLINILPAWNVVKKNDLTMMSTNTDGDGTFAFDVSNKLMEAKANGNKVSFLLEAISNSSYEVEFLSKESGLGPYLIITPYSANSSSNSAPIVEQNISLAIDGTEMNEMDLEIPETVLPLSNNSIDKYLSMPLNDGRNQPDENRDSKDAKLNILQ
jgi:hypothetical protein